MSASPAQVHERTRDILTLEEDEDGCEEPGRSFRCFMYLQVCCFNDFLECGSTALASKQLNENVSQVQWTRN